MLNDENLKKKYQPTLIFQARGLVHKITSILSKKNHKAQLSTNQILKDAIKKEEEFKYTKEPKT